ncbi:Homeodomain-like DNA binding domain-containing transcription factor [Phycomyces blakesleeanus NRRL 1555(-)]|uniref:Homeodomain-like DNA binding domain-containing transcription factor n=1 Tax=Phycomyces blakesleeanus (strain ATCC 8743b / DSM 1359 / FGSC 10004 / NBRC 33097 / NRRL 1555) TaxID=763407 RepID=A0A163A3T0_PHYB8|nr:Homeodomain-like DNA binding domain-containing transcription factor [Phycomyces blakesleeanus NRRL 1555(-)]OAD70881.1 Homeodomain-like DNA binding domain-containing transcription factor [Phycomyces blakesleeanus NRRL 1555(-)]|eukprot:XP_018288921.1 Homeodomain-like DNA binding domain-containing transcription factor [Phycomyces blakesleeanus NRRL 1555(-)]
MSTIFLYEDGHVNVVDEKVVLRPWITLLMIMNLLLRHLLLSEYIQTVSLSESSLTSRMLIEKPKDEGTRMKGANVKQDYVCYTLQDKAQFFDLKIEKCMSASAAAKQLGIHIRTAYRQVKQYNRKCILTENHKMTAINFIDANPSASVVEVTENLLKQFYDLKVSRSTVYSFMRSEFNLSLKKADFNSIERNSPAKIDEPYNWVREWENTDMNSLTNCGSLRKRGEK